MKLKMTLAATVIALTSGHALANTGQTLGPELTKNTFVKEAVKADKPQLPTAQHRYRDEYLKRLAAR